MPSSQPSRSLAAIAFTDVVGYSALSHDDDAKALRLVEEHFRMVRVLAPGFSGRVIKTIGDSVHMEFASAQAATACAIAIQQKQQQRNAEAAPGDQFLIRIGIHVGDVEHRDGDTYGDGVNVAARLQPLAPKGGIAISEHVRGQLRGELRRRFVSRGAQDLKNIATPVEVFAIEAGAIAEISVETPAAAAAAQQAAVRRVFPMRTALAALSIIALAIALGMFWRYGANGTGDAEAKSVAVLPFANTGGDPANEYFSDGLSEELINTLGRVDNLKVMGRTSSFQFKNTKDDPRTIGEKLGVGYLVDGSVRKSSDRVRIGVALVRADDGSNLWSDSYDRDLKDIFGVQSEIATAVTGELQRSLGITTTQAPAGKPGVGWPPSGNVEAYQSLLQGNFYAKRRNATDFAKAIDFYEKAIALDPRYALAYARLAYIGFWYATGYVDVQTGKREAIIARARAAAVTALELDPDLAEAHFARAYEFNLLDRQIEDAEREYRRASELAPQDPEILREYGSLQYDNGQIEQALAMFDRAAALDPLSRDTQLRRGRALCLTGRLDECETAQLKALELEPQAAITHAELAITKLQQGDTETAVAYAREEKDPFWRTWALAMALFAHGDRKGADAALDTLIRENGEDAAFQIAEVYAVRKDPAAAFRWLDRALTLKDPGLAQFYGSRLLIAYRDDPRYKAFAGKVGLDPDKAPALPKSAARAK